MNKFTAINKIRSPKHMKKVTDGKWLFRTKSGLFAVIRCTQPKQYIVEEISDNQTRVFSNFMSAVSSIIDLFLSELKSTDYTVNNQVRVRIISMPNVISPNAVVNAYLLPFSKGFVYIMGSELITMGKNASHYKPDQRYMFSQAEVQIVGTFA